MADAKQALSFGDAQRIARGCTDYGGGYRHDPALFEAYQDGIGTVIRALECASSTGLSDPQIRALHAMGGAARPDASLLDQSVVQPLHNPLTSPEAA